MRAMPLADFERLTPGVQVTVDVGLSGAIDVVAAAALSSHRFLRYQWFAAALSAGGTAVRTIVARVAGRPQLALPIVATGPAALGLVSIPGSYWPFRGFPVAADADPAIHAPVLAALAGAARGVRIGPVIDGDPAVGPLIAAARARGWVAIDRYIADSWVLDLAAVQAEGPWPRGSTLRKNRFHEKHLGAHGRLDWDFVTGDEWPVGFDAMARVEAASWIAARTDGRDAKFTDTGHGRFWRMAAEDPVLAAMFNAAILRVDGAPAAFSFDIDAGTTRYAIANSYDPAFAKHSPGKLLYYRNLTAGLARGIAVVDWGAGDSGYKQVLGAVQGPAMRDWLLLRPGLPALAGRLLSGVWRRSGNAAP
ncbi:hypothetical protein ASE75_09095 [Sphingomonas sp. Leaf17]|uniref:GNAT family N-acetyltransferase n=1 Tax=Sphingomonas sp. Leaf17 TaxID=1735683 RepID=UPI0006FA62D8|nr:GNAT family N-acetyltransferase [Sphingomonas sp. Leaf17]KQM64448.1 hypothetical protein ASE75_09095 [Sphingomonas sp. Leaf17]